MSLSIEKEAELLHSHHKDTFKYVREREKQRDRLFLILIALIDLLLIQVQYSDLSGAFSLTVGGVSTNLSKIPSWLILSMSWTLFLALMLRYFQVAIHVDRQYDYLHSLEVYISGLINADAVGKKIYQRESAAYHVSKGKHFRTLVWLFYSYLFPSIVIIAIAFAAWQEFWLTAIPDGNKYYDLAIALCGLVSVVSYSLRYGVPKLVFPTQDDA